VLVSVGYKFHYRGGVSYIRFLDSSGPTGCSDQSSKALTVGTRWMPSGSALCLRARLGPSRGMTVSPEPAASVGAADRRSAFSLGESERWRRPFHEPMAECSEYLGGAQHEASGQQKCTVSRVWRMRSSGPRAEPQPMQQGGQDALSPRRGHAGRIGTAHSLRLISSSVRPGRSR
jgi:hypothetical protein